MCDRHRLLLRLTRDQDDWSNIFPHRCSACDPRPDRVRHQLADRLRRSAGPRTACGLSELPIAVFWPIVYAVQGLALFQLFVPLNRSSQ